MTCTMGLRWMPGYDCAPTSRVRSRPGTCFHVKQGSGSAAHALAPANEPGRRLWHKQEASSGILASRQAPWQQCNFLIDATSEDLVFQHDIQHGRGSRHPRRSRSMGMGGGMGTWSGLWMVHIGAFPPSRYPDNGPPSYMSSMLAAFR